MNEIPPMTDPMGKYWDQPKREEILLDDTHALMTKATLDRLCDYSASVPSGTYSGKMWRRRFPYSGPTQKRFLCWYGEIQGPNILIHEREILIA